MTHIGKMPQIEGKNIRCSGGMEHFGSSLNEQTAGGKQQASADALSHQYWLESTRCTLQFETGSTIDRSSWLKAEVPSANEDLKLPSDPLNILVVEDNDINRMLMQRMLKQIGFLADTAVNGLEAVEAVQKKRYHIVLMDIQMPVMDGINATQKIVTETPSAQQPKIIAMTAFNLDGTRDACAKAGMVEYLCKPVDLKTLRRIIAKWGDTPFDS